MNKKFFAALASATMAFSATGSLAVFAQDFEDEVAPVLPGTPAETPVTETVAWNKENFGDLVKIAGTGFTADTITELKDADGKTLAENAKVKTADLANITNIALSTGFNGEIKGLEYFTGLTSFGPATGTDVTNVLTNASLDFSANTSLEEISIISAPNLRNIQLPEAFEDEDGDKSYKLTTLTLNNTKLLSIDLTEQTKLESIAMTGGMLQDIQLPRNAKTALKALDLSNNMLDSLNLKGFDKTKLTNCNLTGNHLGTIDFELTVDTANQITQTQTIYVAEDSASVNLLEMYPDFDFDLGKELTTPNGTFEKKNGNNTGVFTLNKTTGEGSYTYNKMPVEIKAANPMYRLYNPNSGEHFYTKDAAEQKALVALGWNDEGYGWVAPKSDYDGLNVYRLYNPNAGDHHYTVQLAEKEALIAAGWKYEGIGWLSGLGDTTGVTVYRQYNPNAKGAGAHNYTMDLAENDYLVALGWVPEDYAWTALK